MTDRDSLFAYRMNQAEETLEDARKMLAGSVSPRSIINRAYYAVFYSVLALFVYRNLNIKSSKHSTIISNFDKELVLSGLFDKKYSSIIHTLFDSRLENDYKEYSQTTLTAETAINSASEFLSAIKEFTKS